MKKISPFALNTYSYTMSHTVSDCITEHFDRGFSAFELMMYPGHLWPADFNQAQRSELRNYVDRNQIELTTLNMPNIDLNIAGATNEVREYSLKNLEQVVQLAGDLGVPGVIIGPGKANPLFPMPKERLLEHLFKAFDRLNPLAEKANVELYVENMPFAFLPDVDAILSALEQYGNERIGIVYDIANGHFIKEDIREALRKCKDKGRLREVHLSDTNQSVYKHDAVGLGTVDFAAAYKALEEIGYERKPILEIIAPTDADRQIRDSEEQLMKFGWGKAFSR